MKRFIYASLIAVSAGFIAAGSASALDTYNQGDMASGIGQSRHNLGSLGNPTNASYFTTNATTEICVFCHTPHHTATASGAPLWNRAVSTTAFTSYGTTIGGTLADINQGGATLACLSCHDGVTTFDNIANKPGKGISGAIGASADQGWSFYKNNSVLQTAEPGNDEIGNTASSRLNIGGSNSAGLSNDHPVSIAYNGEDSATPRASLRDSSTQFSAINLTADLSASASTYDGGNLTKNVWAVNGFITGTASIADLLRNSKVECTSCHDPHFSNKSWNEVDATWGSGGESWSDGMFLRRVGGNTGSGVCRTCHAK